MSINLQRWIDIHCFGSKLRCWEMILTLAIFCSPWQLAAFVFCVFFLRFWQSVWWRTAEDDREMTRLIIVWKLQLPSVFFSFFFFFFEKVMRSTVWNVHFTSDLQLRTIWLQKTLIYCNGVVWASCYFQSLTERVTELKMWFLLLCSMEKLTTYRFGIM